MESNLSKNLKALKKRNKINNEELGEVVGKSGKAISTYILEKAMPTIDTVISMANFFNVSVEELLFQDLEKRQVEIIQETLTPYTTNNDVELRLRRVEEKLDLIKSIL